MKNKYTNKIYIERTFLNSLSNKPKFQLTKLAIHEILFRIIIYMYYVIFVFSGKV